MFSFRRGSESLLHIAFPRLPGLCWSKLTLDQCQRMLRVSASSYVFDYARGKMGCGAASRIVNSQRRDLYELCGWTPYRFFLELFRCPIGDPQFTSAIISEVPVPQVLKILAAGELSLEPGSSTRSHD
jgi:hypothetical protein